MVALPDYVRAAGKPGCKPIFYFEKHRRTPRAWPRLRIPAEPLSEEFARRATQLSRLAAAQDAAGAWIWTFIDVSGRTHPLPAPADCAAFWAAVDKADELGRRLAAGVAKTFSGLVIEFRESRAYGDLSDATREQYDRYIRTIEAAWGNDPVAALTAVEVQGVLDKAFRDIPAAGRAFRATLSRLVSWGIPRGYRNDNPVEHTEAVESDGTYSPWPPEAFDLFFAHARVDLHLAVYSGLFTGQRKVDVLKMIRPKAGATEMPLVAQKTELRVPVQIHSEYRALIDAAASTAKAANDKAAGDKAEAEPMPEQLRLHLRADGVPWSYEGFKTAWGRELDKKELKLFRDNRLVFHGLRKNAVNMLLEVGCTEEQVSAIVGMSAAMVHHYSKEVSRFRLARSAMRILESGWAAQRVHVLGKAKD
ncbi:integrase [Bradyrhizobium sp. SRS-191]|uniref:integrase n=1 Tax=Bradyrhizobium sp. SRS-191 TaxID=2962606 RepID=UPI00211E68BA|nr:integrase [Bradyrhizobium sp. SRS-191]